MKISIEGWRKFIAYLLATGVILVESLVNKIDTTMAMVWALVAFIGGNVASNIAPYISKPNLKEILEKEEDEES